MIFDALKILLLLYLLVVGVLVAFQRTLIYMDPQKTNADYSQNLAGYTPVSVRTSDNIPLTGYFNPPDSPGGTTLLVFHGNGGLAGTVAPYFSTIASSGYGVFLAEYRGYGGNAGSPSEEKLGRDALAYLQIPQLATGPIVLYGQSLGAGVAINLAYDQPARFSSLILEAPFYSLLDVAKRKYAFVPMIEYLLFDDYRSDLKINALRMPKLFLAAGKDEVIGVESTQSLYNKAPEPKQMLLFPRAGHNEILYGDAQVKILTFLASGVQK